MCIKKNNNNKKNTNKNLVNVEQCNLKNRHISYQKNCGKLFFSLSLSLHHLPESSVKFLTEKRK
jgi:hypothetical protein